MSSPSVAARKQQQLLLLRLAVLLLAGAASSHAQKYNAVFNFGDSITDTGNLCTSGKPTAITFTQPPYGETYFGSPTCRCSDGRVIVDFLSACSIHLLKLIYTTSSSSWFLLEQTTE
ncbi:GDSL esterase/lipase [Hordeum vulgare]|nr:GDSL esterase/lipase [Hordeum vulgare]